MHTIMRHVSKERLHDDVMHTIMMWCIHRWCDAYKWWCDAVRSCSRRRTISVTRTYSTYITLGAWLVTNWTAIPFKWQQLYKFMRNHTHQHIYLLNIHIYISRRASSHEPGGGGGHGDGRCRVIVSFSLLALVFGFVTVVVQTATSELHRPTLMSLMREFQRIVAA